MLPTDPSDRPGSSLPGGPPPGPPEGTPQAQPLADQPLTDIVPPAATAHGTTIIRPGTTIIRPGAVAWGGPPDARVAPSRFHVVAQSRCPDDGQVGDMKNSVVTPSDIFRRFLAEKRQHLTIHVGDSNQLVAPPERGGFSITRSD